MTIPVNTTTIRILRPQPGDDIDYWSVEDDESDRIIAKNVRAHISSPSGRELILGGEQESITYLLACDPCDLQYSDRVYDETSKITYEVTWVTKRNGLGLEHMTAGVKLVVGQASGQGALNV